LEGELRLPFFIEKKKVLTNLLFCINKINLFLRMYKENNVQLYDDNDSGKRSSDPASGPRPVAPVG